MDVSIRTASCEGVGLHLHTSGENRLVRNRKVIFRFQAGDVPVEIPGRVAWSAPDDSSMDLGIRFDLALACAASRRQYSTWIVANIMCLRGQ